MEQTETEQKEQRKSRNKQSFYRTYMITLIGVLSAAAAGLMLLEFPLLFIAPEFYKFDFSDLPAIIGSFALGPVAGVSIEALKNLLKILFVGSKTNYIGELANFGVGVCYVLPASLLYYYRKTKKRAVAGLALSTVVCVTVGSLLNAFVLLPAYSKLYGAPMEYFIGKGTEVHGIIKNLQTFILFAVAPFNLLKYGVISLITILIYKRISRVLKNPLEKV
ncbi:MAG: ECF transporter S component [Lachnospiraceae bacterium]|nr:ECF transporter S component [Lachnospiraceae bacterium]